MRCFSSGRTCLGSGLLLLAVLSAEPSIAETAKRQQSCAFNTTSPQFFLNSFTTISACSALIQAQIPNGQPIPPKTLASYYATRSLAYEAFSDFERAIADNEKAVAFFPGAPRAINRLNRRIFWVQYLQEIQDDDDYANWSGPPSDGYWSAK